MCAAQDPWPIRSPELPEKGNQNADGGNLSDLIPSVPLSLASYLALGATSEQRCAAYRALAMETLAQDDIDTIRTYLQRQHALGPDRFRLAIEAQLSRRTGPAKIGRPHKPDKSGESPL